MATNGLYQDLRKGRIRKPSTHEERLLWDIRYQSYQLSSGKSSRKDTSDAIEAAKRACIPQRKISKAIYEGIEHSDIVKGIEKY